MKKQNQSEIQQILAGTKDRNDLIYALWKSGVSQAELGRRESPPISRQCVHKIIKRAQKADKPWWEMFLFWR